jgi:hypothetical protein
MTDYEVRKHCSLPQHDVRELLKILGPGLERKTNRSCATDSETQVLSALSFFRSGSFQYVEGSIAGVSQSTVSLNLDRVSKVICATLSSTLSFQSTVPDLNRTKEKFFDLSMFPNIAGVIDGSHVGIKAPHIDEPAYVNRKGYHSINVQLVCGPDNRFTDAVVKWPGSTHDSYMWNNCALKSKFEDGDFGESWLIGKIRIY